ncbi:hypothetical protein ACMBCM_06040 [Spiroplasma sp. K1]
MTGWLAGRRRATATLALPSVVRLLSLGSLSLSLSLSLSNWMDWPQPLVAR